MEEEQPEENPSSPRRSLRRMALTELNDTLPESSQTPKSTSPDEMVILQRGRRKKPITWSPVDYDKTKLLGPPRDVTPDREKPSGPRLNPKLRRRLAMSPSKNSNNSSLGRIIARKIKSLPKLDDECSKEVE